MSRFKFIRHVGHQLIYPFISHRLASGILNSVQTRIRNNIRSTIQDKYLIKQTEEDNLFQFFGKRTGTNGTEAETGSEETPSKRSSSLRCQICKNIRIRRLTRNKCESCNQTFCKEHGEIIISKL